MKILFVSSGNNKFGISPIVKAQAESLTKVEDKVEVEFFTIVGKGFRGYLKNIFKLRKYLKSNNYDLLHSHFFLSSVVATFSNPPKLVVSLMGSDVYQSEVSNYLIRIFAKRWDALIVKSEKMKEILGLSNCIILPNGVNFEKFYPIDKHSAREKLDWDKRKYVLFASNPNRPEKNYTLAEEAIQKIKVEDNADLELVTLQDIPHDLIIYYLNAADVLLMTSKYEGSPNIIKEAMSCNCPIVSTDVGDVSWVMGNIEGCYLITEKTNVIRETIDGELIKKTSDKLREALEFAERVGRTKGRDRIMELGLDSETVANKIISIYKKVTANIREN